MTTQHDTHFPGLDQETGTPTLKERVEDFLALEAELLDERRYGEWLELLADDIRYFMPLTRNVAHNQQELEHTREKIDFAWFDENKHTLSQRVQQIAGGDHWAEEPLSRTTHLLTNIRIESASGNEVVVRSRFLVHVNRREDEIRMFVGKRRDVLRVAGSGFIIARRELILDQSTLQAKNLTTFF